MRKKEKKKRREKKRELKIMKIKTIYITVGKIIWKKHSHKIYPASKYVKR